MFHFLLRVLFCANYLHAEFPAEYQTDLSITRAKLLGGSSSRCIIFHSSDVVAFSSSTLKLNTISVVLLRAGMLLVMVVFSSKFL